MSGAMLVGAIAVTAMALLAGIWAWRSGQFGNVEDSKYTMLDTADNYDDIMAEADLKEAAERAAEQGTKPGHKTPTATIEPVTTTAGRADHKASTLNSTLPGRGNPMAFRTTLTYRETLDMEPGARIAGIFHHPVDCRPYLGVDAKWERPQKPPRYRRSQHRRFCRRGPRRERSHTHVSLPLLRHRRLFHDRLSPGNIVGRLQVLGGHGILRSELWSMNPD